MTNTESHAKIESINPVLAVAPIKEETEMSEATNKITALYCRLSQEDREPESPCPLRTKRTFVKGDFTIKMKSPLNKMEAVY